MLETLSFYDIFHVPGDFEFLQIFPGETLSFYGFPSMPGDGVKFLSIIVDLDYQDSYGTHSRQNNTQTSSKQSFTITSFVPKHLVENTK